MIGNILRALAIFAFITGLAVAIAVLHNRPPPPPPPKASPDPAAALPLILEPSGSFQPAATPPTLRLRSVGDRKIWLRFYRLHDRALMLRLYRGVAQDALTPVAIARLLAETVVPQMTAAVTITKGQATVLWPGLDTEGDLPPGFYAVTAALNSEGDAKAVTWFIRSNLHVMAIKDAKGWHALCQNMHLNRPATGAVLSWFGFTASPVISDQRCRADGASGIAAAKIPADNPLQILFAENEGGHLAFVPLNGSFVPPTRQDPDDFFITDRAHYEAGQNVMVVAYGEALTQSGASLALVRPDGLRVAEQNLPDAVARLAWRELSLPQEALAGRWKILLLRNGGVQRETEIDVGYPRPPLKSSLRLISRSEKDATLAVKLSASGDSPLLHRAARLQWQWEPARNLPQVSADYAFGGYDQPPQPPQADVIIMTGTRDHAVLPLPEPPPKLSYPVQARAKLVPVGKEDFSAAQSAVVGFPTKPWALGLKADFGNDPIPEGEKAVFKVALFKTDAAHAGKVPDLRYELVTERRSFRWFFENGRWDYKADYADAVIDKGSVQLDDSHRGEVAFTAGRGSYRLDVLTSDRSLVSSWRFQAGMPLAASTAVAPLRVQITEDDDIPSIHMRAGGLATIVAADENVRQVLTDSAAEMRDISFALDPALKEGVNILAFASRKDGDKVALMQGESWLPPQRSLESLRGSMTLPAVLKSNDKTSIAIHLDQPTGDKTVHALVLVVPAGDKDKPRLLTIPRQSGALRRIYTVSNVFGVWPPKPSSQELPLPKTVLAASTSSAPLVLDPDGTGTVELALPKHQGTVHIHLLLWNDRGVYGQVKAAVLTPPDVERQSTVQASSFTPPVLERWTCQDIASGQDAVLQPTAPEKGKTNDKNRDGLFLLSPAPMADFPESMAALLAAKSLRSSVGADFLLTAADYESVLSASGMDAAALEAWRRDLWQRLLQRQLGDGAIAEFPNTETGDLAATAAVLRAWIRQSPTGISSTRREAMIGALKRRLGNAWGAEHELPGRTEAFYALATLNQIDAAALRYFVEKYGNQIRDAVYEAQLAAALKHIQDREASNAFAARAIAQLPSLRGSDPVRTWRVLEILARHELASSEDLVNHWRTTPIITDMHASGWLAVESLAARMAITRRMAEWQADFNGRAIKGRGVLAWRENVKPRMEARWKTGSPLSICSDVMHSVPRGKTTGGEMKKAAVAYKTDPLVRTLYTESGKEITADHLMRGQTYILVLSGKNWTNGISEIELPMPPGLVFRAIFPGGTIAGPYSWLKRSDRAYAAMRDGTLMIALERDNTGDGAVALILEAAREGRYMWEPATLSQNKGTQVSEKATLSIQ